MSLAEQAALDQLLAGLREFEIAMFRCGIEVYDSIGAMNDFVEAWQVGEENGV